MDITKQQNVRASFSDGYKQSVFQLWYRLGKPIVKNLYNHVEDDPYTGERPTINTLQTWIVRDFPEKAEIIDREVENAIQGRLVQEKVEMFERHTKTALSMQDMAMTYLDGHKDELKIPNAVRMLVEGIRVERESRGIPQVLEKMMNKSDEELLKEVQNILVNTPVEIQQLDEE